MFRGSLETVKSLSLRTSPQTGVAIRNSLEMFVFLEWFKENGFPRPLRVLGMTFFLDTLKAPPVFRGSLAAYSFSESSGSTTGSTVSSSSSGKGVSFKTTAVRAGRYSSMKYLPSFFLVG